MMEENRTEEAEGAGEGEEQDEEADDRGKFFIAFPDNCKSSGLPFFAIG
jgi:hypothetical protein